MFRRTPHQKSAFELHLNTWGILPRDSRIYISLPSAWRQNLSGIREFFYRLLTCSGQYFRVTSDAGPIVDRYCRPGRKLLVPGLAIIVESFDALGAMDAVKVAQPDEAARGFIGLSYFDSVHCAEGIKALDNNRKTWNEKLAAWSAIPVHDWACITGDTKVLTRAGKQSIKELPDTGEVLTPCGWKRYVNPRITRKNAPRVEVKFEGGLLVRCTAEHLFLTDSGWKFAISLLKDSLIQSSLTRL